MVNSLRVNDLELQDTLMKPCSKKVCIKILASDKNWYYIS